MFLLILTVPLFMNGCSCIHKLQGANTRQHNTCTINFKWPVTYFISYILGSINGELCHKFSSTSLLYYYIIFLTKNCRFPNIYKLYIDTTYSHVFKNQRSLPPSVCLKNFQLYFCFETNVDQVTWTQCKINVIFPIETYTHFKSESQVEGRFQ